MTSMTLTRGLPDRRRSDGVRGVRRCGAWRDCAGGAGAGCLQHRPCRLVMPRLPVVGRGWLEAGQGHGRRGGRAGSGPADAVPASSLEPPRVAPRPAARSCCRSARNGSARAAGARSAADRCGSATRTAGRAPSSWLPRPGGRGKRPVQVDGQRGATCRPSPRCCPHDKEGTARQRMDPAVQQVAESASRPRANNRPTHALADDQPGAHRATLCVQRRQPRTRYGGVGDKQMNRQQRPGRAPATLHGETEVA